jgi:DNA-binding NtrC family response regulator
LVHVVPFAVPFAWNLAMSNDAARDAPNISAPLLAVVIDDDASIRDLIDATVTALGMKMAGYVTAKPALAAIDTCHPAIIFLDVALLNSDAIDVIRGLSERHYGGIVQLMSGGRPSLLEAIGRIGVRHRMRLAPPLNKPFRREAIVQVIEKLRSPEAFPIPDREAIATATSISR